MVIVDASVWIDFLYNQTNLHTEWLYRAVGRQEIALTSLTLCEVLQGVRHDRRFRQFQADLLEFPVFEPPTASLAIVSAQNFRRLRAHGVTVRSTIDCLVATFCIERGFSLLHRDRDFDAFEDYLKLNVIHPETDTRKVPRSS